MESGLQVKSNQYLLKLTVPVFIEMLFGMLIGNMDQFMMSTQSENAYAAIGNANQIINLFLITFNVVAMASTILISQYIGAKDTQKTEQLYSLALLVNVIFGVLVSLVIVFFNGQIFRLLSCPEILLKDSVLYITIVGAGMFLQGITTTYSAFFKSNGYMKESMYVSLIMNIINTVGNAFLIFGWFGIPRLGIVGVAISTNVSKLIGVFIFMNLYKKRIGVKISFKQMKPFPFPQLRKMFAIGVPSAGESISWSFAMIILQKVFNKMGANVVKAKVTVGLLSFVSWIFANAISSTTQVIVGYLMGARDVQGTHERYKSSLKMSMMFSFIGSIVLLALSKPVCGIFVHDPEILKICQQIMIVEIFLEQGRAVNLVTIRALQACGDTKFPIVMGIIDEWIVAVGGGILLGVVFNLGVVGVWSAMAADEIIRATVFTIRWKKGKWRRMVVAD